MTSDLEVAQGGRALAGHGEQRLRFEDVAGVRFVSCSCGEQHYWKRGVEPTGGVADLMQLPD